MPKQAGRCATTELRYFAIRNLPEKAGFVTAEAGSCYEQYIGWFEEVHKARGNGDFRRKRGCWGISLGRDTDFQSVPETIQIRRVCCEGEGKARTESPCYGETFTF